MTLQVRFFFHSVIEVHLALFGALYCSYGSGPSPARKGRGLKQELDLMGDRDMALFAISIAFCREAFYLEVLIRW